MTRRILVVSANGGVGRAVTEALLEARQEVWASVSSLEAIAGFQTEFPACVRIERLDLADADHARRALSALVEAMGRLDAVIVCGAISPLEPAEVAPLDSFRRTLEINCVSHLAIYQACIGALRRSRGRLVFVSSVSGRVGTPMMAEYCASKFALEGLADVLRQEASGWGVRVILLQPGTIDTPIIRKSRAQLLASRASLSPGDMTQYGALYDQMLYRIDEALSRGTMMPPREVAAMTLHVLNEQEPAARYPIGDDAKHLIAASRSCSDAQLDELILGAYKSAPV